MKKLKGKELLHKKIITEPNDITGVLIVFDNGEQVDIFDIPAVEFDGKKGHKALDRLKNANGTWINTDNANDDSFWVYDQISPRKDRYDDEGKQLKTDGPWFKYQLDMSHFNLIHGRHSVFIVGFAP